MNEDWVVLAVIGQPHGVSGRVKVKSFTEPADAFAEHTGIAFENGTQVKLKLTGHTQGMAIISIEGVTDRNQAELLRGRKLVVARSVMPELEETDRYYIHDLIGMQVMDTTGAAFGEVANVVNYGASDILEIQRPGGALEMYAFTHVTFPTIDTAARRITIDPPEMLE